jgi:hypothetical protein
MSEIATNKTIIEQLNDPKVARIAAIGVSIFIAVFVILLIILVFNNGKIPETNTSSSTTTSTDQETQLHITGTVFIIIFLSLILFATVALLLPNFKEAREFMGQIKEALYVVAYTIFLIIFFRYMEIEQNDTLNKYAQLFTIGTFLLTGVAFYKGLSQNYVEKFNIIYERIKNVILLFCFITIMIIFYDVDPGGLIKENFGYSLILTIVAAIFGLLYLIISFTLPKFGSAEVTIPKPNNFAYYGGIGFVLFLAFFIISMIYTGGVIGDNLWLSTLIVILFCVVSLVWAISIIISLYIDGGVGKADISQFDLGKKSLLYLFGFILSGLIIAWISYSLQNMSSDSGIVSFVLNLLLVLVVLMLVYRTVFAKFPVGNNKKNAFVDLIVNLFFYIPCIFSNAFDGLLSLGQTNAGKEVVKEASEVTKDKGTLGLLALSIGLLLGVVFLPVVSSKIAIQGGNQLVNQPVHTNKLYSLGSFEELNGSLDPDYQYAISFWLFIDSAPPNTNPSYNKYTSILNFSQKPQIFYKAETNTLMVTMNQKDLMKTTTNKMLDFDENGNRIILIQPNFLLQKWNNIIINYNGGTLDIFINNELVKSANGVIAFRGNDLLTIGQDDGIYGGISNLVYYRKALTINQTYFIYNSVKNKNPPTTDNNVKTIISHNK